MEQAPPARVHSRVRRLGRRLLGCIVVAAAIGFWTGFIARHEANRREPAGFAAGLVHGAAMPCMLPALAVGKDVFLYAPSNEGRPYKLGYTLGVNLCGALFFGLLYRQAGRRHPACDPGVSR